MSFSPSTPARSAWAAAADLFAPPPPRDPADWVAGQLGEHLWSRQRDVFASLQANRHTAVRSCHGIGKSFVASRAVAWWIDQHPPGDAFAVTSAPTAAQVEAILWREIGRAHRAGSLPGRLLSGAVPMWKRDGEIVAFGRKPQDLTNTEEAAAAFQGIHARHVLVVLDEAGGIPKWLWDAADSLATNDRSRVLAIGNPTDPTSHFAKVCAPGSGWHVIAVSAFDAPAFTGEPVPPHLEPLLVSRTWVRERRERWGEASALYQSKVLGEFPDVSDDTLIPPALVRKGQATTLPGLPVGRLGVDVARYGTDETVVYRNRGGRIRLARQADGSPAVTRKQSTTRTAGMVAAILDRIRSEAPAVIDTVGVGGGVFDQLLEDGRPVVSFGAGERAREPDRFANRRAEMWWQMREALDAGEIDLPPDGEDDDLAAQLQAPKWWHDGRGRIHVESKESMRKRGVASPDRADAAIMSLVGEPPVTGAVEPQPEPDPVRSVTGDLLTRQM